MEQQPDALLASIRFFGKLENRDVSIDDGRVQSIGKTRKNHPYFSG